jgi:hypothetical protein
LFLLASQIINNKNSFVAAKKHKHKHKDKFAPYIAGGCPSGYKPAYIGTKVSYYNGNCFIQAGHPLCMPPQSQQCPASKTTNIAYSTYTCNGDSCHGGQAIVMCTILEA